MNRQIAKDLLSIQAVQINPKSYFTWTSGIKSPIYCDNRLTISYPNVRKNIIKGFIELIQQQKLEIDVIAGCATAGIPHAAFLAEALNLPMVYVRSQKKFHGKESQIEGIIKPGMRVLVIEDLISTGGSAIHAAKALEQEGANIVSVFAIFSYNLKKAKENFKQANLPYKTITTFDDILELLVQEQKLTENEKEQLLSWRNSL